MSQLTLLLLRFGLLLVLWVFIFAIVYSLRSDLFGQRVRKETAPAAAASPFLASAAGPVATALAIPPFATPPAPLPVPVAATEPVSRPWSFGATPPGAAASRPTASDLPAAPTKTPGSSTAATRLVIVSGPKEGLELSLPDTPLTIGRASESGLVIRDDYTSTHHARLMLWDASWVVQDLDSTNGTFLDGIRVTLPTPVPLNTPVRIGTTSFELRR